MELIFIVSAGFVLDLIFGDPYFIPHPIRLIGNMISYTERFTRKLFPETQGGKRVAGAAMSLFVITVSAVVPWIILCFLKTVNVYIAYGLETFWVFQIFATHSLKKESMRVYRYIKAGDIENSRKYLSWIVGRDTEKLSFFEITKAVVETIAENTSDGVIAPMFFMLIGGAPLGFMYKAVNTLDSMVGYKNDKYLDFGRFSAKLDDVFNYVPARITGFLMAFSSCLAGLDMKNSFKIYFRDKRNHSSPNSAQSEAACAGALNVQLAGDTYYFGKLYKKKTIGDDNRPVESEDIVKANRLMYATSIVTLAVLEILRLILVTLI